MMGEKIELLFVDDESRILDGVRRRVRPLLRRWEVRFAESAEDALKLLDEKPADVVVSDMRMPVMNGGELLHEIRKQYPATIRLILSGQTDTDDLMTYLPEIHQFLPKPTSVDVISQVIEPMMRWRSLVTDEAVLRAAGGVGQMFALPESQKAFMEKVKAETPEVERIGQVVCHDVGMSVKILQLVHSAFLGLPRETCHPSQAVKSLGIVTMQRIVERGALFVTPQSIGQNDSDRGSLVSKMWDHAEAMRICAGSYSDDRLADSDENVRCELASQLSILGRIVLSQAFAEVYEDYWRQGIGYKPTALRAVENEKFGVGQEVVGAYLLSLWGFPDSIVELVANSQATDATDGMLSCVQHAVTQTALAQEGPREFECEQVASNFDAMNKDVA